ncbi:helix-turn-helix transcriptional regulator [Nocardia sp. NPDC005366]|uniref:helix-turn-helix transcriptional regulator n=1 Tax=Nocardia sp. NPDC005366 TaxID=3156878 RepID=UPI0033B702DD
MAANAVLREAILNAGMTPGMLAERVRVDAKTVERWISQGRRPHPVTRHAVAVAVGRSMAELWPSEDSVPVAAAVEVGSEVSLSVVLDRLLMVTAHLDRLTERLESLEKVTASMGVMA